MIYLKQPGQETDIIVFGKPEEQIEEDLQKGISRFGGDFRQPSYSLAYLKSARVLLDNAIANKQLDEFGLPIFYMVRHAFELKLKDLLGLAYDVFKMRHELYNDQRMSDDLPSNNQLKRLENNHDVCKLYEDLKSSCEKLKISIPISSFDAVVKSIHLHEVTPTWSRYNKSTKGLHVKNEVVLPIVKLVQDLESLFEVVSYDFDNYSDTVESELYSEFNSLLTRLNNTEC